MKRLGVFLWMVLVPLAVSAQGLGHLEISEGSVKIHRHGADQLYQGTQKIEVKQGDEIQTGSGSKAFVVLSQNQDKIELYSSTFFKVASLDSQNTEVNMNIGKARFKVAKPPEGELRRRRFNVRTANAVIGVKGTEFILGTGAETTNLLTLEGEVGMASAANPKVEVSVKANEASKVETGRAPTAPSQVPAEVQKSIVTTDSNTGGFNEVKFAEPVAAESTENKAKTTDKANSETAKEGGSQTTQAGTTGTTEASATGETSTTGEAATSEGQGVEGEAGGLDEGNPQVGLGDLPGGEVDTDKLGGDLDDELGGVSLDDVGNGTALDEVGDVGGKVEVDQVIDRVNTNVDQVRTNVDKATENKRSVQIKIDN